MIYYAINLTVTMLLTTDSRFFAPLPQPALLTLLNKPLVFLPLTNLPTLDTAETMTFLYIQDNQKKKKKKKLVTSASATFFYAYSIIDMRQYTASDVNPFLYYYYYMTGCYWSGGEGIELANWPSSFQPTCDAYCTRQR
jgi:hypothetical protein